MKRILATAVLALATISFSGCYHVKVTSGAPAAGGPVSVSTHWHFIGGLTGANVNAAQCRDGIASVDVWHPWWSWGCVIPFTGGLVAATTTSVTCAQASHAERIDNLGKSTAIAAAESSVMVGTIGL